MIRHAPWASPPHDFSIGLRPIDEAAWFEGGDAGASRKAALLQSVQEEVWGESEGSQAGQAEVLGLIEQALQVRGEVSSPPLWAASLLVADDLCLMERRDGEWTVTAISLCSPTYFTAAEVLGKPLSAIHGPVPGFADRFLKRVTRIFDSLPPGAIVERRNWTVTASDELFLPRSAPVRDSLAGIDPAAAAERIFVRVERQTLRRLPESGAVLFTIRPWCDALARIAADPEALQAFAIAWRSAPVTFRDYKGLASYDALVEAVFASR